jgi:hypothetical protein
MQLREESNGCFKASISKQSVCIWYLSEGTSREHVIDRVRTPHEIAGRKGENE